MKKNIPRRHHYIPQYYLKGFSVPENEKIWVYDKENKQKKPFNTNVKNAAVEKDFYKLNMYEGDDDTKSLEQYFANEIEGPTNPILNKIREGKKIDRLEKYMLAYYMYSTILRIPAAKEDAKKILPEVEKPILEEAYQIIDNYIKERPDQSKSNLQKAARGFIRAQIDNPSPIFMAPPKFPKILPVIMKMNWYFLCTTSDHFLTSDNPVFTHRASNGLLQGEFTFPVSKNIALWATTHKKYFHDRSYQTITPRMLKEINRRTVQNATRFVFSSKKESWINQIVKKDKIEVRSALSS